jgi:hypothetical protein
MQKFAEGFDTARIVVHNQERDRIHKPAVDACAQVRTPRNRPYQLSISLLVLITVEFDLIQ